MRASRPPNHHDHQQVDDVGEIFGIRENKARDLVRCISEAYNAGWEDGVKYATRIFHDELGSHLAEITEKTNIARRRKKLR